MNRFNANIPKDRREIKIKVTVLCYLRLIDNFINNKRKKIMNVKIVNMQREQVGIIKLYTLRYLVFSFVNQIPAVGPLINLVDILFIFGKERRCLHDRIAGTFVIKAK